MNLEKYPLSALQRYASITLCAGLFILPVIDVGGRALTVAASDLVLPFLLLFASMQWLASASSQSGIRAIRWHHYLPFVAWFGWIAISALVGLKFRPAAIDPYVLKKLIGFILLGLYVLAGYLIGRRLPYDRIVQVLLIAAAVGSAVGFLRLFILPFDIRYAWLPYGYRLLGMTHNPNLFGLQQAAVFVLCIDWLKQRDQHVAWTARPSSREWLLITVLAGLWLSGSRTAILALAVALACGLVLRRLSVIGLVRSAVLSAGVAAAAMLLFSAYRAVMESVLRSVPMLASFVGSLGNAGILTVTEPQGVGHRAYIHQRALDMFAEQPWFGTGLGQFYLGFQASGDPRAGEIHNSFLWILTELGIVGLVIALWCIGSVLLKVWRLPLSHGLLAPLCLAVFYSVSAFGADIAFQRPMYFFAGVLAVAAGVLLRGPRSVMKPGAA